MKIEKILVFLVLIGFISGFTTIYFFHKKIDAPKNFSQKENPSATNKENNNNIEIFKNKKILVLTQNNKQHTFSIATGKNIGNKTKVGDLKTPLGKFKVISFEKSDQWSYDFEDDDKGPIVGAYGPWFIRLQGLEPENQRWQGIGIHGTHNETTIGKNDTHGCIRMKNKEVTQLKDMITKNYLVTIYP